MANEDSPWLAKRHFYAVKHLALKPEGSVTFVKHTRKISRHSGLCEVKVGLHE